MQWRVGEHCSQTFIFKKHPSVHSGPPSKPGRPEIIDYDKDYAEIKWTPSKDDGGSPISKYMIEKKKKGGEWEKVSNSNE